MSLYEPEVGDYVIWETTTADKHDEGWVYFKCPPLEENINNNRHQRYITIETGIRLKPECETETQLQGKIKKNRHKYIHTLLLCFEQDWHQLKYIKSRANCKSKSYYNRFQSDDTK